MKRPFPTKVAAMKARKRPKSEQGGQSNAISTATQSTKTANRRKVRLDDLQWKEVAMPDRLDDFEGFYGLEEIDDVDVVRDGETGKVSFETTKPEDDIAAETGSKKVNRPKAVHLDGTEDMPSGDEPWEGFSEDEASEQGQGKEQSQATASEPAVISYGAKDTKAKPRNKRRNDDADNQADIGRSVFEILADKSVEDEEAEEVDVSAWKELGLSPNTLGALRILKFSTPTSIQASAIPEILEGHDVVGKASTGSGKTLAFGIPILEAFLAKPRNATKQSYPSALIVSPTRELAHQLAAHITALCSNGDFDAPSIATITGGLSIQKQRRQLVTADIIIGTPGRLWEVISSGHGLLKSLMQIQFLVVDEADRLLSKGHFKEMAEILNVLDRGNESEGDTQPEGEPENTREVHRQTLVFSATFHKGLQQKLASKASKGAELMNNHESMEYLLKKLHFREDAPKFIDANPTSQMATNLQEGLIECAGVEKDLYLYALLLFHPKKRALVFTNSISAVRRLTPFLQNLDLPALPLHSQMPQKARLRSVERFTERPGSILVATDVAARGLDIANVQLIIHYHLPRSADTYVHRSGRTARADASGSSILICAPEEVGGVRRLVAKVHARSLTTSTKKTAHFIRTLDMDRRVVSRLKPRATLSKRLADAVIAKEKKHSENDFLRAAAEDLGVEYDSETLEKEAPGKRGRGSGRKKKEKEARAMGKGEMQALRTELRGLLSQRVNTGVSERYLTSGGIDVEALISGEENGEFLGSVGGLGFDEVSRE